jgi:hypothetical protein
MYTLQDLTHFQLEGPEGPVPNDWASAARILGTRLPSDLVEFIDAFGGAKVDDFLSIYKAGAENKFLDLSEKTLQYRETLNRVPRKAVDDALAECGASIDDLIAWGGTDNADMCFVAPDRATGTWFVLVVVGRDREIDIHDGTVADYLTKVLKAELVSDVFPEDFPDPDPIIERRPNI